MVPLGRLLLICACAVVSGARTITEITEITEWGQRATTTVLEQFGILRHLPGRSPGSWPPSTGDALDGLPGWQRRMAAELAHPRYQGGWVRVHDADDFFSDHYMAPGSAS
ncbi:hypothetical protein ACFWJA_21020 [Streptomyces cadmiisoli]|uniref:GP88 family protein n=1 Tax=Streptomyces cadmiisoli TaxID=2184053 RepID=UPI00365436EF